jgi:putative flippase GtrA
MRVPVQLEGLRRRYSVARKERAFATKAVSFAMIGVVNTVVDVVVFFLGYAMLTASPAATGLLTSFATACRCGTTANVTLVAANLISWTFAASGSYVMNSYITFALESGRQLRFLAYAGFLASGVLGLIANTSTLVVTAQLLPVWAAKACAIFVSFLVNFSMTNFVVFRQRPSTGP